MFDEAVKLVNSHQYFEAIKIFKKILKKNTSKEIIIYANIAYCHLRLNEIGKSLKFYLKAEKIQKNNIEILNGLATVYFLLGNNKQSIYYYHKIFKIKKNYLPSISNIANLYFSIKKFYLSKKYYLKIYQIDPKNLISYRGIFRNNYKLNLFSDTLIWLKRGKRIFSDQNLQLDLLYLHCAPNVHFSKFLKKRLPKRFQNILEKLIKDKEKFKFRNNSEIIDAICSSCDFHLAYCHQIDIKKKIEYSNLINYFTNKFDLKEKSFQKINLKNQKIKIAFISSYFYNHTVLRLYYKFITDLSDIFEIHVIHTNQNKDWLTKKISENKKVNFVHQPNIYELLKGFYNDNYKYDVIFYPEIGMDPEIILLSSLRLSKIQCMGWGHPISTGKLSIDYFVSSEFMENIESVKKYSEKLIKLPFIGLDISKKIFPKKKLSYNPIDNRNKVVCLQSVYKILPEDMNFFFELIKQNKEIKFFFISDKNYFTNIKFKKILKKYFERFFKNEKKFEEYFIFEEPMDREVFIKNIQKYDLAIDTLNWSGGNTHLEALLMCLPVVTLPGNTMRSRHTFAFLKKIKCEDLVANTRQEYKSIIIRLLNDNDFYKKILEKIDNNNQLLYNNKSVCSFEQFLKKKLVS